MGRIDDFWKGKKFLMYGYSRDPKSIARLIYNKVSGAAVEFVPVRKDIGEVDGIKMVNSPTEAGEGIDGAFIVVGVKNVPPILEELKQNGINRVFLQIGAYNRETLDTMEEMGFDYETGCALTRFDGMGFPHSTHRWVARRFGGMKDQDI